jgi:hypothetical protein
MRAPVIDNARAIEQPDEGLLFEVSDEALEAAANQTRAVAAMSFPNAPTVSILVMCCTNGRSNGFGRTVIAARSPTR